MEEEEEKRQFPDLNILLNTVFFFFSSTMTLFLHDPPWTEEKHVALVGVAAGPGSAELLLERAGPVDCCGGGEGVRR